MAGGQVIGVRTKRAFADFAIWVGILLLLLAAVGLILFAVALTREPQPPPPGLPEEVFADYLRAHREWEGGVQAAFMMFVIGVLIGGGSLVSGILARRNLAGAQDRRCPNGHIVGEGPKFCPECGAPVT